jgi:acyl-CoA reductase-like NAD-dependent aldehyde dehydrogenase
LPDGFGESAPLWIAGQWRAAATKMPTIDPSIGMPLMDVDIAQEAEVDMAVEAAQAAAARWWRMDGQDRARILRRIADGIRGSREALGLLDTLDAGRPIRDTVTRDTERAARLFEFFAGVTDRLRGATVPVQPGRSNYVEYEPYGVVGAITPWNYPLTNAVGKIAPALATANAVILKPAEQSPLSALLLAHIAHQAGLPAGLLSVLNGPGPITGDRIARHPAIGKLTFTGSTDVGRHLGGLAGTLLKSVTLELGGKSGFVVFADTDLEIAADALVFSATNNAGQTCTAATRLIVEESVAERLLDLVRVRIGRLRVGDALQPDTMVGPIISAQQRTRIRDYIEKAEKSGAIRLPLGRLELPEQGYFVEPVIFVDADPAAPISQEEVFGPVVTVVRFSEEEEALALANGTRYGLATSLWTDSLSRAQRLVPRVESGLIWINSAHSLHPASPYGGYKQSGLGTEMGSEAVQQHMRVKSVWVEHGGWESPWSGR